ncbi:MAG: hypothetical protein HY290_08025 [Planctomycetia bacterium]|nr:hypothetical protein [Planctomycetia bacterium]
MAVRVKLKRLADLCRLAFVALGLLAGAWALPAGACPICGVPTVTLTERLARADVALLVEWVSSQPATNDTAEKTTYEIVQVHRDALGKYKTGDWVSVGQITAGKAGNLFLLMGQKDDKLGVRWEREPALAVSETSYQYIIQAPSSETPADKRLSYFIKFLEFPDVAIANDAFSQFVNAPTKDIYAVAAKLPREKLRRWLADSKTPPTRRSGYGLMLGMCGDSGDAKFLEGVIDKARADDSLGIVGVTFGYLLLTGDTGLTTIEKSRLANKKLADGEVYDTALAIRYFWSYGNGKISPESLRAAMRLLIDRPALAEIAIIDLARWKDWDLQQRLMALYKNTDRAETKLKEAIIHYMIACTKDVPKESKDVPQHVVAARKHLDELRQLDPKLVASGEKLFYLK